MGVSGQELLDRLSKRLCRGELHIVELGIWCPFHLETWGLYHDRISGIVGVLTGLEQPKRDKCLFPYMLAPRCPVYESWVVSFSGGILQE